MMRWQSLALVGILVLVLGSDWRQFRGSHSNGIAPGESLPDRFAADRNVAWKVDLPGRGVSSPVIAGNRVFVTASSGPHQDRLHVLAFRADTGRLLWERHFWATGPAVSHPKSCMAAPTPATDGKHLVALFATNDLVGLDVDGNVLWIRSLYEENPGARDGRGLASSPAIVGGTAIVHGENQNNPFALGVDVQTGATRWRIGRPREIAWTSPIALPGDGPGKELVLLQGSTRLSALDPLTGKEVWAVERHFHPIASSVLAGNVLYVPGENELLALELQPGNKPPKLLWQKAKLNPDYASPVVINGKIYSLRGPILVTGDARTGEVLGQLRLKGEFSSSAVSAGGLIYCFNEDGTGHVVRPEGNEGKLVSSGALKEKILCTPAIADGALYVRSDSHLWKIGKS